MFVNGKWVPIPQDGEAGAEGGNGGGADVSPPDLNSPAIKAAIQAAIDQEVAGLKTKNSELLGEVKRYKGQLQQFDGVDMEKIKPLLERMENDEDTRLMAEGKTTELVDKYRNPLLKQIEQLRTDSERRISEAEKSRQEAIQRYNVERIGNAAARHVTGLNDGALPTVQELYAMRWYTVDEENNIVPNDQAPIHVDGKPLQIKDLGEYLLSNHSYLFKSSQGGGALGGGKATGKNTLSRAQFETASPAEQMKFIKGGGKITD